ncbi:MAG TPA: protein translocase subunit SecF [Pyrinomonadaceae bacterium]|jgi:preprotein translocase subunit SecF
MIQLFKHVNYDWLGKRRLFLIISALLLLGGLASAAIRQLVPGGTEAFNSGVDFKGGTVVTVRFTPRPADDAIRSALSNAGIGDSVVQPTDKPDVVLIKVAQQGSGAAPVAAPAKTETPGAQATQTPTPEGQQPQPGQTPAAGTQQQTDPNTGKAIQAEVDPGGAKVKEALSTFGPEGTAYKIEQTEAVGPIAGRQLRNQAIAVTLLALVGMLLYIAFRFEWTYGAAAVLTVFHDVLVTLGFFSLFQWEISLTVVAALLTLVGFSVNDTIVTFDRVRENLRLRRRETLYNITNEAINQTLSRTIITAGLVFFSVFAMVLFGGEVLRGFSLALLIGIVTGTYSTIAIASPIMVWWQQRLDASKSRSLSARESGAPATGRQARARRAAAGGSLKEPQGVARS